MGLTCRPKSYHLLLSLTISTEKTKISVGPPSRVTQIYNPYLQIDMISAILFDFGGTLDSDGQHWLDRFYRIYEQIGLSHIPQARIKEAFYWADAQLEKNPAIQKAGFREMMTQHVHHQFEKLALKDPTRESEAAMAFARPSEKILHRNRHLLEKLHQAQFQ